MSNRGQILRVCFIAFIYQAEKVIHFDMPYKSFQSWKGKSGLLHKLQFGIQHLRLNFLFRQAMLPDNDIWCDPILAVIEEYDPVKQCQHSPEISTPLGGEEPYIPSGSIDSPV